MKTDKKIRKSEKESSHVGIKYGLCTELIV